MRVEYIVTSTHKVTKTHFKSGGISFNVGSLEQGWHSGIYFTLHKAKGSKWVREAERARSHFSS